MKKACLALCLLLLFNMVSTLALCESAEPSDEQELLLEDAPYSEEAAPPTEDPLTPEDVVDPQTDAAADEATGEIPVLPAEEPIPVLAADPTDEPAEEIPVLPTDEAVAEPIPVLEADPTDELVPEDEVMPRTPAVVYPESLEIGIGESVTLPAVDGTVIASDSGSVSINGNAILGKKLGTALITVTNEDSVAQITVTVLRTPYLIYMSLPKTALSVGDCVQPSVTYAKGFGGSYTLTSSNEAVLRIDPENTVTAVGPGKAYVIATSYNGRIRKCAVTVKALPEGYTMSRESLVLGVGQTITITAVPTNDCYPGTVWSSSAPEIVSVVNGKLTARAEGSALIRAEAFNGVAGVCEVTVNPAPTTLTAASKTITLAVGERAAMGISTDHETELTYRLSSRCVRLEDDGMLTAVSAGTCVITVSTFNRLSVAIKVLVRKAPTSVALPATLSMEEGSTRTLTPTFRSGQGGTYTLVSSNESVLRVSGNTIEALGPGDAACTVTTFNGLTARCDIHVYAAAQETTMPETLLLGLGEICSPGWQVLGTDGEPYEGSISTSFSVKGILSVSGGRITAVKKGSTKLTVTAGSLKRTCVITVDDYSVVHPAQAAAHRGGFSDITENTLAAFNRAAQLGARSLEIDVQSTKDGIQIINHDTSVLGDDGNRYPVGSYTYTQLKAKKRELCTLEEALALLHQLDMQVFIELKETADVNACLDIVRAEGIGSKAVVYSGDIASSASIRNADPDVSMAYVYHQGENIASVVNRLNLTSVLIKYDKITTALVTALHKLGVTVMVYTVNTEGLLSNVLKYGADYILTNYPEWLL